MPAAVRNGRPGGPEWLPALLDRGALVFPGCLVISSSQFITCCQVAFASARVIETVSQPILAAKQRMIL